MVQLLILREKYFKSNCNDTKLFNGFKILVRIGKESYHLDKAVEKTLEDGLRTPDIMSKGKKKVSTSDMGDAIISNLN